MKISARMVSFSGLMSVPSTRSYSVNLVKRGKKIKASRCNDKK